MVAKPGKTKKKAVANKVPAATASSRKKTSGLKERMKDMPPPSFMRMARGGAGAIVVCALVIVVTHYAFRGGVKHQGEPLVKAAPVAEPGLTQESVEEIIAKYLAEGKEKLSTQELAKIAHEAGRAEAKREADRIASSARLGSYRDWHSSFARRGAEMTGLTVAVDSGVVTRVEKLEKEVKNRGDQAQTLERVKALLQEFEASGIFTPAIEPLVPADPVNMEPFGPVFPADE